MSASDLFDCLANGYDDHFAVPHRRLYDDLAWERVASLLPSAPAVVVDAGCGTGRWVPRLAALGHRTIGIEAAPRMADRSAQLAQSLGPRSFGLIRGDMAQVELDARSVDVVLAMGSLQYTDDPGAVLRRFACWLRPGGVVVVLVDSLGGLVIELLSTGRSDEAIELATSKQGHWSPQEAGGQTAPLHLFDRVELERLLREAGFCEIESTGLLVAGAKARVKGPSPTAPFADDAVTLERSLSAVPALADLGKHLLVCGRLPESA